MIWQGLLTFPDNLIFNQKNNELLLSSKRREFCKTGAVCRYLIGLIPVNENLAFPVKTFAINILGSFALETGDLIKGGNTVTALVYVILSVAAGVAAVFGGQAVVR